MGIIQDIKTFLFPAVCPVCGGAMEYEEKYICTACLAFLPRMNMARTDDNELVRRMWTSVPVKHAASLFRYLNYNEVEGLDYCRLIHKIKHPEGKELAVWLGHLAALEMRTKFLEMESDVIVPVPLTAWHMRKRGYNQSAAIAQGISEVIGLPVCDCMTCDDGHMEQKKLNAIERKENSMGHFHASVPPQYKKGRILLVDDIFTSGATMTGCALALLADAPEAQINVFALTRA